MTEVRSPEDRRADGKGRCKDVSRSSHGEWSPTDDRPDPVDVITGQGPDRVQALLPIRHGSMAVSPFTLYHPLTRLRVSTLAWSAADADFERHLSRLGDRPRQAPPPLAPVPRHEGIG